MTWCKCLPATYTHLHQDEGPSLQLVHHFLSRLCCLLPQREDVPKRARCRVRNRSSRALVGPWRSLPCCCQAAPRRLYVWAGCHACLVCTQHVVVPLRGRGRCLKSRTCLQRLPPPVSMIMRCLVLHTSAPMCRVKGCAMPLLMPDSLPAASLAVHPAWCRDRGRLQLSRASAHQIGFHDSAEQLRNLASGNRGLDVFVNLFWLRRGQDPPWLLST